MELHKGKLKLAISPCPNDTFIFGAWLNGMLSVQESILPAPEVSFMDIQELNNAASDGIYDVIKVSAAIAPTFLDKYRILPCGGALGDAVGPLLVSKEKIDYPGLLQCTVALPGKDTTATQLFRFAFPQHVNIRHMVFNQIEDAILDGAIEAGVLIHEGRFTYASKGLSLILDLGQYWSDHTGLRIPLGLIMVKRELPDHVLSAAIKAIQESIAFARQNDSMLMPFIKDHASELSDDVIAQHIGLYVNEFSIDLGTEGIKACRKLFETAQPEVRISDQDFVST
ncbi:MAG: 1,4-dihydroxy-6-naphthoate synthase [Saprospiraceae bacterium]|nr:1,4-dihydroxy-6-naphthoate synthase [Saprospiraceae bacterium]HMW39615.1 1,4-dihydroxy-6-naphthoate synthase [Saprospiraceae bacterium]HMX87800.1 1,4-dihydroxy-6-naphthoate synthase [Saprospiraceae bacterium]HMZ39376.1 1,4-dihydroxy-6-naphthoate synthase [Saprospiraceae bacterium]HNA64842.1 1,4-dihydroxy-6-naphthoate synthase [Saprospiraceae bacterium]